MATYKSWATVRVTEPTREVIKIAAAASGMPMSKLIDEAVTDWVRSHQGTFRLSARKLAAK